ncbi:MAG: hypothetical protein IKD86_05100 [Firmicutes bacterium]|nr:hypothetical protein [Bacillota bacterium]
MLTVLFRICAGYCSATGKYETKRSVRDGVLKEAPVRTILSKGVWSGAGFRSGLFFVYFIRLLNSNVPMEPKNPSYVTV